MHRTTSRLAVLAAALSLSACGLTPSQQRWAGIAAGVLIVGAIAAHDDGSPTVPNVPTPRVDCVSNPEACR